jgi:hypothetical protein
MFTRLVLVVSPLLQYAIGFMRQCARFPGYRGSRGKRSSMLSQVTIAWLLPKS